MSRVFSISEQHGLAHAPADAKQILSVGISTALAAELDMLKDAPDAHITATTLDDDGIQKCLQAAADAGVEDRITLKNQNVADDDLTYDAETFDYIYARLVLHYLSGPDLRKALANLFRVAKTGSGLYVVVRSINCEHATAPDAEYDEETGLTSYKNSGGERISRYFHSQLSITGHLRAAGWLIDSLAEYDEQLSTDFDRKNMSDRRNNLIEVLATKP